MSKRQLRQAVALYESFREKKPRKVATVKVSVPAVVACMGHVEFIGYRTTHGKKLTLYKHDFAPGSRPLLCVSADGRQLMLLGGRYKWTDRGIVDRDAKDREIENESHGEPITDPWDERTPSVLRRQANPKKGYFVWNYWDHKIIARTESWAEADKKMRAAIKRHGHVPDSTWFGVEATEDIEAAPEKSRQTNARNHLGEKQYQTFAGWKRAAKAAGATWFDGDKDIAQAMTGPRPYAEGQTRSVGEWDGAVGIIFEK